MKRSGLSDNPLFINKKITKEPINIATTPSLDHDGMPLYNLDSLIPEISQTSQEIGREVCTYRLTQKEKMNLYEIIYHFRRNNIKVSENLIARIAINYLVHDFNQHKQDSILSRVLDKLQL